MNWIERILTGWNFMRMVRLLVGIYIGIQAILMTDALTGILAVFFLYQAVTNTSCCGVQACAIPTKDSKQLNQEVSFQEVEGKSKK